MDERSSQDLALFARALELPAAERPAYLAQACGADAALRHRVETLLQAHERAGDFLEQAPTELPARGDTLPTIGEKAGDRIGRYKLLQQIGEGGCGVVFMAEQEQPVRRLVALKVVKPGMDTKNVIARFEAERQALALMEHPNIAKVLDAGATEAGRPYFVMELVRGIKITDYCDQNALPTHARLELFIQVCQAVQHAHQKGIIHRDLKPSNILVTTDVNGEPLPQVIDFGIAKATTGQRLTDKTVFTAFEMLIGTPAYMSPEQAALTNVDVDTRTDIYSLGVLLYELLTGTTPFDAKKLLQAGLDEARQMILHQEPVRPSTRLSTMLAADLTTVAQRRQIEPPKLIRAVQGDLDWIVVKALEKDRTRRYHSASGFAEDVRRYLANEPIGARPPTASYRLYKLAMRNKIVSAALLTVLVMLISALAVVYTALKKERKARLDSESAQLQAEADKRTAEAEAAKSQQVTAFLQDMLRGVGPSVAQGRDTQMLREILDRTAARITTELTNQPTVEAELCFTLGKVYDDLGAHDVAERMYRRVLQLNRMFLPDESPEAIMALSRLGYTLLRQMKLEEAEQQITLCLELCRKVLGEEHPDTLTLQEHLAMLRWRQDRLPEAEAMIRHVYQRREQLLPAGDPDVLNALNNLGNIFYTGRRYAEAEEVYKKVLAAKRHYGGNENMGLSITLQNLGATLFEQGKTREAEAAYSEAVLLRRKQLGKDHPNYATSVDGLADVHRLTGNFTDAETLYRESLALELKRLDKSDPTVLRTLSHLVTVLSAQKKHQEIDTLLDEFMTEDFLKSPKSLPVLTLRMELLARFGRWQEAAADAFKIRDFNPHEHMHYHTLAPLLVAGGNLTAYRALCEEILTRFGDTKDVFIADRMAKDCLIHPAAGVDLARVAKLADFSVTTGTNQPAYPFFQFCKALVEYRQGNFAAVATWAKPPSESAYPHVAVEANALLAMAEQQLQQPEAARASLARAVTLFQTRLPKLESGDLGDDWRDWIIAHALIIEAETLIATGTNSQTEAKKPEAN